MGCGGLCERPRELELDAAQQVSLLFGALILCPASARPSLTPHNPLPPWQALYPAPTLTLRCCGRWRAWRRSAACCRCGGSAVRCGAVLVAAFVVWAAKQGRGLQVCISLFFI